MPSKNQIGPTSSRQARNKAGQKQKKVERAETFDIDELWASLAAVEPGDTALLNGLREQVEQLQGTLDLTCNADCAVHVSRCLEALDACLHADLDGLGSTIAIKKLATVACDLQQSLKTTHGETPTAAIVSQNPRQESESTTTQINNAPVATSGFDSTIFDPELFAGFIAESSEHLDQAESHLLALETETRHEASLSAVFRAFHSVKGAAGFLQLPDLVHFAHEAESLLDLARCGTIDLQGQALELARQRRRVKSAELARLNDDPSGIEPEGMCQARKSVLAALQTFVTAREKDEPPVRPATDIATAQPETVNPIVETPLPNSLSIAPSNSGTPSNSADSRAKEAVRVDRDRLDRLIDLIGEMVIAESMVQQEFSAGEFANGNRNLAQLSKITRNLQEMSLSLRMVPVKATFQKMARLARDLAKKVGKPVDFQVEGEDTELDKTVVDQIGDPLMHMVRNAIDHGLEATVAERTNKNKPAQGLVTLRAFHRGGNIYIETEDDGRGLDRDKILAKARRIGLVAEDADPSNAEVFDLIFQPGFSTADNVTDVSGRGVGMDVVRRNVEALRGTIELKSQPGQGTCCSMRLPLTLAIIDGLVVRVGGQRFIIPTLSIVELMRLDASQIKTMKSSSEFFTVPANRHLPLLRIERLFAGEMSPQELTEGIVVVVEERESMAGLFVDEVLGQQQAVIKRLGKGLENQPGLAGGAIMPDGKVGLILDVHSVLGLARGAEPSSV